MRYVLIAAALIISVRSLAQDTTGMGALGKETVMSEVVIRSGFDVAGFLQRVKNDTTFYKAFRTLHILGFTSLNDIKMMDKKGSVKASLQSKTIQHVHESCRTMETLDEKTTGDMYDAKKNFNYYTA